MIFFYIRTVNNKHTYDIMKKIFLLLLLLVSFAFVHAQNNNGNTAESDVTVYEHDYIVKVGDVAPDFTLEMLDGTKFTLSEQRGKVVMLQFTAGWCGICRKEMPYIESDIWLKHKDNKDFVLVGIDREETKEAILPFIEKVGTTYPIAMDSNGDVFASYALRGAGITRNILIDRDGKIVMLTRKFEEPEFKALVEKIDAMLE